MIQLNIIDSLRYRFSKKFRNKVDSYNLLIKEIKEMRFHLMNQMAALADSPERRVLFEAFKLRRSLE